MELLAVPPSAQEGFLDEVIGVKLGMVAGKELLTGAFEEVWTKTCQRLRRKGWFCRKIGLKDMNESCER
jgi:hypothetical protein